MGFCDYAYSHRFRKEYQGDGVRFGMFSEFVQQIPDQVSVWPGKWIPAALQRLFQLEQLVAGSHLLLGVAVVAGYLFLYQQRKRTAKTIKST